jgi:tetratricopeptide (TPR) repeat protein
MQRPVFLSGKVMVDDGTPPPETVVIERVCNGVTRPEAYTDSKGHFSFQLGQNTGAVMADASVGSGWDGMGGSGMMGSSRSGMGGDVRDGFTERQLQGCEIRAALPGYRSDVISLAQHRAFDNPELGVIVLHRMGKVEGRIISATNLAAPKDARKALEKAQDALKKKKLEEAEKQLQKAVEIYPKYATAWFELGRLQEGRNQAEAARLSYRRALEADPKFITPYLHVALLAAREQKWKDVAEATDRALQLDPYDYPQAYFYNSVANFNLQNLDAAEKSAREAKKLDTEHRIPKVEHLLGVILAQRRDYTGAAEQMRTYLKMAPRAQDADAVRKQLADIERLTGEADRAKAPEE